MATRKVIVMTCDKCGTEGTELSKFRHVKISTIQSHPLDKMRSVEKDLCLGCLGMPGVNHES